MGAEVRNAPGHETVERRLARIASGQHGIVTREQAVARGITRREFDRRVRNGSLFRLHRGVYRLGHRSPSLLAGYMAATKAGGEGAGVSGLAGAHLLGLVHDRPACIEVTTPRHRRVPGVIVHRARTASLPLVYVRGIPAASPAWTLLDIAASLDDTALGKACHAAHVRYRLKPEAVARVLAQRGAVKDCRRLMRILAGDDPLMLSRLEAAYLGILRGGRVELPATNQHLAEGYVDCHWPRLGLIVELDSYRFHGSRHAWERDRERDRAARRRGEELIRYTSVDVFGHPDEVLAQTRAAIAARRA